VVSETFGNVDTAQTLAQGRVLQKQWWVLLAIAREFMTPDRAQRYALHALVLGIGALSLVAVVW
jgi:hypothetical protein